jgi:squalene-associated FAD-dependent desaturase
VSGAGQVVIVGGGLAGITTALRCADAGRQVALLEGAVRLGGLTTSFHRGDLVLDNGQHVFLRCCTSYRALLERLGVTDRTALQQQLDIPLRRPDGRTFRLRRQRLPAPLHLGRALLTYGALSLRDRLRVLRAAVALRGVDVDAPAADRISFGQWLADHGQTPATVDALWDLFGIATLNATADDASLALAATVFQQGLLTDAGAGDIGWSLVPLEDLHAGPALRELAAAGVDVRLSARVEQVEQTSDGWELTLRDGTALKATDVVLATPPTTTEQLLPADAIPQSPGWAERLGAAPIVNVHVHYDRQVMDQPFFAAVDSPVQWVFDRTASSGATGGQCVAVSLSAADELIDLPAAQVRALVEPALVALLPAAKDAVVLDACVTRERAATFRPAPGSRALRPSTRTTRPGLFLAGSWTDTGWPATMEGAVRSGESAAAAVLEQRPAREAVSA